MVAAYEMLAGEGWVRSHTGKGTFLVARPNAAVDTGEAAPGRGTWFSAFSRSAEGAVVGSLQAISTAINVAIAATAAP